MNKDKNILITSEGKTLLDEKTVQMEHKTGIAKARKKQRSKDRRRMALLKMSLSSSERNAKASLIKCLDISFFGKAEEDILKNVIQTIMEAKQQLQSSFESKGKKEW